MTYNEFIQSIIDTKGQWSIPADGVYEIHHILPKCLGGLPLKIHSHDIKHPNLIWLTPSEHYTAHKLLIEEHPDNYKLIYAFWRLSNRCTISAEDYEFARKLYIKARKNSTQSDESNKRRSETMKNHKLYWYTNGIQEIRAPSCPEGYVPGRATKIKEISKKYFGKALPGEKNGMYGKHHSAESNKKRSEWSKDRHWYNNGQVEVFEKSCPDGFVKGRLTRK